MAGAVHLETQHTAASAKDIEMWLCVTEAVCDGWRGVFDRAGQVQRACLVLERYRSFAEKR